MALKLIPCPELKDSGVIEKVFRYNLCIDRRKSQGYCEKKLKLKKKKIKKKFCNIRALTH